MSEFKYCCEGWEYTIKYNGTLTDNLSYGSVTYRIVGVSSVTMIEADKSLCWWVDGAGHRQDVKKIKADYYKETATYDVTIF